MDPLTSRTLYSITELEKVAKFGLTTETSEEKDMEENRC